MSPPLLLGQAHDPDEVRRTVGDVLSQRDYGQAVPSLFDRAVDWLLEQVGRLLLQLGVEGEGPQEVGASLALVAVIVILLLLLGRFLWTVRRSPSLELADSGPVGRAPASWLEEARRHEASGEFAEALRCRYRLTVARLADVGLLREIPGRTTGEYLHELRRAVPAAREPFARLTQAFEEAFYGRRPVSADDLRDAVEDADEVARIARLPRRVRAGPGEDPADAAGLAGSVSA